MARHRVLLGLIAIVAVLAAATPAPASSGGQTRIHPDIAYAAAVGRGHLLDLYIPGRRTKVRRPVLIVMGGSGWFGDNGKAYASSLAPFFTAAGPTWPYLVWAALWFVIVLGLGLVSFERREL